MLAHEALLTRKTELTLTFWFFVLIGGFFSTACKASVRFPVQERLRKQHSKDSPSITTNAKKIRN